MTVITPLIAAALLALPPVAPPVEDDNWGGSYERDAAGIIEAFEPNLAECTEDEDLAIERANTLLYNQQYTIVHDHFGREAAEKTNYGWVSMNGSISSKIRTLNGYSLITTTYDDDYVATRHFVVIIDEDGQNGPETDYLPGNAGLALAA